MIGQYRPFLCTAGGRDAGWAAGFQHGGGEGVVALVFLRTERIYIWLVIDFTPDFTPHHTSDLTTDPERLRRADATQET